MAKLLKLRRGTTSQHSSFTGAEGEVTVDTDKETLVVHNGAQAGGYPLARESAVALKANSASPDFTTGITLKSQAPVLFEDDAGGQTVGLKAPTGVTTYAVSLPATAPSSGKVLKATSATALEWGTDASASDTNTTYSISCADGDNTDEEKIRLSAGGSGSGDDDIVLEAGTGLSVARSGDKITFTNTVSDTNTTYTAGNGLTLSSTEFTLDLTKDQTWTGSQRGAIETEALTGSGDTRTLTLDFATGNNFYVDLVGSVTTVAISNPVAGQSGSIIIKQSDSSANKTIAGWNGAFDWGTKSAPTITQTQNKFDRIDYFIYSATQIHVIHSGGYDG